MTKRYHIWTEGCQMNVADSAKLAAGLDRFGWQATDDLDADLVVLNTCVVRESAEQRAASKLGTYKKLKRKGADFQLVVMGCMVGPKTDELRRRFPYVDHFARPQAFEGIFEALGLADDTGGEFWPTAFPTPTGPTAYVPVIHGCDKFCTYCIVPYRRGREQSRPLDEVVQEVAHLVHGGVREVTLLGQTVEAYGLDFDGRGPDLADLMTALHELPNLERIRFLTSYPKDMTPKIVEAVRDLPKVCEFFNIPVQAGSDAVLERMRRGYTIADYRDKVELIRSRMPDAALNTDVIVGFCGETEAEFQETYRLLEELRFDKVHVAAYSPRPGTIAHKRMEDDVPPEVKSARLHAVEELEERVSAALNERLNGTEQEVLVEGRRDGRWHGRTQSNKLVHFAGDASVGEIARVHIDHAGAWSLQGVVAGDALAML